MYIWWGKKSIRKRYNSLFKSCEIVIEISHGLFPFAIISSAVFTPQPCFGAPRCGHRGLPGWHRHHHLAGSMPSPSLGFLFYLSTKSNLNVFYFLQQQQ